MAKRRQPQEFVASTSSTPPRFPKKQEALFREVLLFLNNNHFPYAVSGAFALQHHTGICRSTKDLDIFLPPADASRALDYLQADGFECEIVDPIWLAKAHRDGYFVDLITGMSNATLTVDAGWIQHSLPVAILGVPTKLLGAEELLASKLFVTRRERFDGADIAHIIYATRGQLDWQRISCYVAEHWGILLWSLLLFQYVYPGHSDYVPKELWQTLLGKLSESVFHPKSPQEFRGSLIDPCMFAIDVNEWGLDDLLKRYRSSKKDVIGMSKAETCAG
jgi:hypothetical protein